MALELYDNATSPGTSTVLVDPISDADNVLPVADIASEALLATNGQFRVIVINLQSGETELMLVTANAWTPQWTVERGIEGTEAISFPAGSVVKHILTAGSLQNLIAQISASQYIVPKTQQGGSYTFGLSDVGSVVESTSGIGVNFSIPDSAHVPWSIGHVIEVCQLGGGKVTIVGATLSVTLLSPLGLHATKSRYSTIGLRMSDIDQWVLSGDLG